MFVDDLLLPAMLISLSQMRLISARVYELAKHAIATEAVLQMILDLLLVAARAILRTAR